MNRWIGLVSLLAISLVGAGCAVQSHSDFDPATNFSRYQSFAQAPPPQGRPSAMIGYSAIAAQQIQEEIASTLESKGFQMVPVARADMLVAWAISGEPRTDVVGYGPGWYGNTYTEHYVQGNLVVNIYDTRKKQLIWHGWATEQIYDPQQGKKAIPKAVQAIFKKFPPQPKS